MMHKIGDIVQITGGFVIFEEALGPVPGNLRGAFAKIVPSGKVIEGIVDPGAQFGTYGRRELDAPQDSGALEVISDCYWKGRKLAIDGFTLRSLSPLELLAFQAE